MEFSKEQRKIVDYRENKPVIVSAAAGSGKTHTLIGRAAKIIADTENRTPADRIVITTFTNKAADELRERLKSELETMLKKAEGEKRAYLNEQLIRLEEASVCTISSFCLDILRKNINSTDLSAGFSVIEKTESDILKERALSDTMEGFYDKYPKEEREAIESRFFAKGENRLSACVLGLYNFSRNLPDPNGWIEGQKKLYGEAISDSDNSELEGYIEKVYEINRKSELAKRKSLLSETDRLIRSATNHEGADSPYVSLLNSDRTIIEDFFYRLKNGETPAAPEFEAKERAKRGDPKPDAATEKYRKKLSSARSALHNKIKLICFELTMKDSLKKQMCNNAPIVLTLIKLYYDFAERYSELKRGRNCLDFSDIEQNTITFLKGDGREVGEAYDMIVVDEFQDSNDVQYEIFRLLSGERNNLFFVGDIKQSIYRFRGANPLVFKAVYLDEQYKRFTMNTNYRSGKSVIDAVNAVFKGVMTEELGEVSYDEDAMLRLPEGKADASEDSRAELYIVDKTVFAGAAALDEDDELERATQLEAEFVAGKIRKMVAEGFSVSEKSGGVRPCGYGDFAILLGSTKNDGAYFEDALKRAGVPVRELGATEYLSVGEISLAVDLLTVIDNPYNDMALLHVLMSPLYLADVNELAKIRIEGGNYKKPLYTRLIAAAKNGNSTAEAAANDIAKYVKLSSRLPVERLIYELFGSELFERVIAASENGAHTAANLRLLLYYANSFSHTEGGKSGQLGDFLRYLSEIKKQESGLSEAENAAESNSVRIMTIHGSKGLEFPVCFVCRSEKGPNLRDSTGDAVFDMKLGIAMRAFETDKLIKYETAQTLAFSEKNKNSLISEYLRLLYVAATRARDKLIFTACEKIDTDAPLSETKTAENSFLSWLIESGAFDIDSVESVKINADGVETSEGTECDYPLRCKIVEAIERVSRCTAESERPTVKLPTTEQLTAKYSDLSLTEIPAKLSATQLGVRDDSAEGDDKPGLFPRKPDFMKKNRALSGKKRGDAYHKAMELLDFKNPDIKAQLEALRGRFTEAEYGCLDIRAIEKFFETPLGRRAAKSDRIEKEFPIFTVALPSELGIEAAESLPFVQGIADMFFYEKDGIVLVDYKTNRNTTPERLTEEYQNQLRIYKRAIEAMTGTAVKECYLYSFSLGREIET